MAIRQLVTLDISNVDDESSVLRQVAERVVAFDDELHALVQDLLDTMDSHEIAIGLAAPQIGVSKAVAVIDKSIVSPDSEEAEHLVIINPECTPPTGKKDTKFESCMSLPPWSGPVEMRKKMHASYQSLDGERHDVELSGFMARVFRHEADHLQGLLYVDYVDDAISNLVETDIFD